MRDAPTYPDCSTCGHNASGVLGGPVNGVCTAFRVYPAGDPRGMAGHCGCHCPQDPVVKAWLEQKVCIGCERGRGDGHENWCPVVTGTLSSLDRKPRVSPPAGNTGREQLATTEGGDATP
jgi:hypothetical protein